MRAFRRSAILRAILFTTILSLLWLQIGPALAGTVRQSRLDRQNVQLRAAAFQRASHLSAGQTDTPSPALRAKIAAKEQASRKSVPAVRVLSAGEMKRSFGRGPFRNPYFNGTLPWQRSFRDVNMCNGNLFKSFTDIQVAPARGAGLVLQRTYNSNDAHVGPFGVGWTHAYDIRIQEAADVQTEAGNTNAVSVQPVTGSSQAGGTDTVNEVPRTDFFGAKHTYHRDADGLYSPPPYLYDEMSSDYDMSLTNGPTKVEDDTEKGQDGTVKHYVSVVTLADGSAGNERACDYIQDRYGNKTTLTYGQSYVQWNSPNPLKSTRKLLTQVTDPTGRSLAFAWTNLGTTSQPVYRITQTQGPLVNGQPVPGVTSTVTYGYYTDPSEGNAANDLYNLHTVTLDAGDSTHLNRTTTYTYTSAGGTYYDQSGNQQTATETSLLASVTDPVGSVVSYQYDVSPAYNGGHCTALNVANSVWVVQITEPGGTGPHSWWLANANRGSDGGDTFFIAADTPGLTGSWQSGFYTQYGFYADFDAQMRVTGEGAGDGGPGDGNYGYAYDGDSNVTGFRTEIDGADVAQVSTYGAHGNLLTQNAAYSDANGHIVPWPHGTTATYYNASQYFQKQSATDALGHTTVMGVGASTAGMPGDPDPNVGDRGQTLWVRDAGYADSSSPSYQKQYTYTYNGYGQKTSETNLRGVVTGYYYGGDGSPYAQADTDPNDTGDLIAVVQDVGGAGHLNRTTRMQYDAAGRVLQSIDPLGQTSRFTYNVLGQPVSVATPARGSAPAETIVYGYDGAGRTQSVQDNRGTTTMVYQPGTSFVQSVTDPQTGTTSYTYGSWGERLTMTLPGGGTWHYGYDTPSSSGVVTPVTGSLPWNGANQYYQFPDPSDFNSLRRTCVCITDDQGREVDYAYTDAGKITDAQTNMVWDAYNRNLVGSCLTHYAYASSFTNGGVAPPSSPSGQLTSIGTLWHGSGVGTYMGQPVQVTRTLSQNAYTYDDDGQRLSNTISTQPIDPATGNPKVDSSNNPVLTARTEQYGYDTLSRLKSVDYGDGQTQGYTFDAMGNRAGKTDSAAGTSTYGYDAANRLTSVGSQAVTSDADGNTLSDSSGRSNVWDSQNRLVSCTLNGVTSTYTYGADGLRRTSTTGGKATYYVYDGQMLVREMQKNAQGQLQSTATYLNGPRGPEYRRDDNAGGIKWYVFDGLGSVAAEVDPSGSMTSTGTFDVYGAKRAGGTGTATSRQGFVGSLGHISDSETGLVYMRARYYDPSVGRFISEDPAGQGINWFIYCSNNPVNNVDATGKELTPLGKDVALFALIVGLVGIALLTPAIAAVIAVAAEAAGVAILDVAGAALMRGVIFESTFATIDSIMATVSSVEGLANQWC